MWRVKDAIPGDDNVVLFRRAPHANIRVNKGRIRMAAARQFKHRRRHVETGDLEARVRQRGDDASAATATHVQCLPAPDGQADGAMHEAQAGGRGVLLRVPPRGNIVVQTAYLCWFHIWSGLTLPDHSHRRAIIGSTFAARCAGIQQASSATAISSSGTAMNVTGSVALTPKSSDFINRVSAKEAANPIAMPASVSFIPCPVTILSTAPALAPSAIRTPISRVRCATEYAITP